ncbi:MAG: AMP-binding protein [Pseudomonadota bacterium]
MPTAEKHRTLPQLLLRNYRKHGSREIAMREKDRGIWQSYTWADYHKMVKYLCLAFVSMGLKRGERVSIIAENKPHAYWFELAAQSIGGVIVGIFADCTPPEVEFYVSHSESSYVVCQNQEQVDKILEIKDKIPGVRKVIYWDKKGLWSYSDPILINMDEMLEMGKAYEKDHPGLFEESVAKVTGDDMAVFFYSSGTTGVPKAAMMTHENLIGMAETVHIIDQYKEGEEYLSFMPIAWITEQLQGVTCSLVHGLRTNFPEEPETVQENIREIGPQVVFFAPRLWEGLIRMITVGIEDSLWIHRLFYKTALKIGHAMAEYRMSGKKPGFLLSLLYALAYLSVFRPLRDNIGLSKTRIGYTAGSAVSPDVIKYYHAIGINVKQMYGSSEMGVMTCHFDNDIRPETCGPPLPGVDIKLSEDGEILVNSPFRFSGYYRADQITAEKFKGEWYYTGDFGYMDKDGHLIVMDRMEDLLTLAGGQNFSPQYCEVRLRFSLYIKDVLVAARETESYIGVLVNIDLDNLGHWAETHHIPYTTFADLSQKPQVIELIRQEIVKVNEALPEYSRIRKFINLHKEFDPDEAEMTRTRKIRRTFVEERFKQMIDAIFGTEEEMEITSQIIYRDGRRGVTKSIVKVTQV